MSQQDTSDAFPFLSNILNPGSSLHPHFLFIVDCTFLFLLFIFIILAIVTSGNIHVFILMVIELCLWASVKLFVAELQTQSPQVQEGATTLQERKVQ